MGSAEKTQYLLQRRSPDANGQGGWSNVYAYESLYVAKTVLSDLVRYDVGRFEYRVVRQTTELVLGPYGRFGTHIDEKDNHG